MKAVISEEDMSFFYVVLAQQAPDNNLALKLFTQEELTRDFVNEFLMAKLEGMGWDLDIPVKVMMNRFSSRESAQKFFDSLPGGPISDEDHYNAMPLLKEVFERHYGEGAEVIDGRSYNERKH